MTTAVDAPIPADGAAAERKRVQSTRRGPRRRLFAKYAGALVGLVSLVLLINGSLNLWFSYDEATNAAIRLQREKAVAAAQRIEEYIAEIEKQIGWTTATQWATAPIEQRRFDFGRLQRQVPAITELIQLDSQGREQLTVSRLKMDVVGSGGDYAADPRFTGVQGKKVWFGPVYFRKESEPYMTMAVAHSGRNAGVTIAEVNLKLIWDVITAIKIGKTGYAYVVDDKGRLIAHPDISRVLRNTDLSGLPQVEAAHGSSAAADPEAIVRNLDGHRVLSASAAIPKLGWLVFVEQPLSEALAPLFTSVLQTGLLLVLGLAVAILAGLLLARRMTGPIRALDTGAARIGAGALDHRIVVRTGDELEELAERFNTMAGDLQSSYADLEKKVEDRTAELTEALDQQTATAEVLGVINSSPGELAPVFDAMLDKAMHLCDAAFGVLWTGDGESYQAAALRGVPPAYAEFVTREPRGSRPGGALGRLALGEPLVHIPDTATSTADQMAGTLVELGGIRTLLAVPLRKDGTLLGAFTIYRQEPRPFSDKQIALLQNFAAQAVIAIENTRLINETREALDQQTATAEVLGVINSSPGDLVPVFEAMIGRAMRLCSAAFGYLMTYDGERFQEVAHQGLPPRFAEYLPRMDQPGPNGAYARIKGGAPLVHIVDLKEGDVYLTSPLRQALVDLGGARTSIIVALRKDEALLGVLTIYRQEIRPFSEKQIALMQNFAAQAVIAMENARLITETREALEQQTATAEVLQVINSSPGDLAPVFEAILEKAHGLCGIALGELELNEDGKFHAVAMRGVSGPFAELLSQPFVPPPGSPLARLLAGEPIVQIADLLELARQQPDDPRAQAGAQYGLRTVLFVPLRKDEALLGYITAYRQEVRPFTEKEIALLQNFAAQAVIAMENTRLITETREALEQQTATAEVLQVINSSPGDLAPVFDAMLDKAIRLCEATHGHLFTYDGELFHHAAARGEPRFIEWARQAGPVQPYPNAPLGRVKHGERIVHVADIREEEVYRVVPIFRESVELRGVRSQITVALLKDNVLLGAMVVYRQEVRPFSDKQIALLQNFAAQAVIAMENARLITETREALDQQTATAEVLGVINSSPGDLAPVFNAMLEKAMHLCEAAFGILWTYDGERLHAAAIHGATAAYTEFLTSVLHRPTPSNLHGRLLGGGHLAHFTDVAASEDYKSGDPMPRALVDLGGGRTLLGVPLRKDGAFLGDIVIYRREVRPFSDKQIALLQNFAAQAVIAMENARLITETREALEQQTATAEVLGVINSSPGNLAPVFDAILEKAHALCDVPCGSLQIFDGELFRAVATRGLPEAYATILRRGVRSTDLDPGAIVQFDFAERAARLSDNQNARIAVEVANLRTVLFVPLRKDDVLVGRIAAARQEARPFTDKQIALLQNFAVQAVIAMENARLITETREALEQQTATAEVLGVINSSPGDLAPVFDSILEKAHTLCEAAHGALMVYDGEHFRAVATHDMPEAFAELLRHPFRASPDSPQDRLLHGERFFHNPDVAGYAGPASDTRIGRASVEAGVRTLLMVPLRKDGALLGYITAHRKEVRPFSDKQIALLQSFAAQAVIAMENARLITETREALDQQTATAEVLQVINASPGDLTPVFDAMLEKATSLCEAAFGVLLTWDGEGFHRAAWVGAPGELIDATREETLTPAADSLAERFVRGEKVISIDDLVEDERYRHGAGVQALVRFGGARSYVGVALRKDDSLLGLIAIYRQEVRPFSDKQIALLQNFAAQAVIAIENARLLNELRDRTRDLQESLEHQTATSDVLKVISQSGAELEPVLQTLVETAARISEADKAMLQQLRDGLFRIGASFGFAQESKDYRARNPIAQDRSTPIGRMALERRVVHVEDALNDPEFTDAESQRLGGFRTMLAVPLFREDAVIGGLFLSRSRVEPFTDKQIALVSTFADQAVIAIENARLFNELRARTAELGRSVDELQMLSEVGQAVSSTLDLRAVLSTILTRSVGLTGADAGAVFRYSRTDRSFRLAEAVGWDASLLRSLGDLRILESETAMGEATARRAPVQLADLVQRPSAPLRDVNLAAGFRGALIVPLVGPERILGALVLQRRAAGEFSAETVQLMQTLASQSVLAIQNARLFREIADKSEQLALASQHKSQFLANMSHELRTPLNAILGYAELLVDGIYGVLPDRPKGVLERIQNNGRHLLALINDVLDLAKIEAGQLTLTLEDYALAEVVRTVVTATEPLAASKGLKFTAAVQDAMPMAHGDARRVSQVLLNLVGNAIKFTDAGEVEIRAAAADGQFVLTVRDTGLGIPDADQDRIFGEFQQIDNSNTRQKGGTGLGLAISKRMVEMQGGTIAVESALGEGSTFRVVLPVHVDEMMEAAE